MWESDYPHDSMTFPNDRRQLEQAMWEIADETARRIVETNARSLFRIP